MKKSLTLFPVLFSLLSFGQQYSQKFTNVNYAGDGQAYHNMDIYLPQTVKSKYPVVVYIYGSAWSSNSGKGADMSTIGSALLNTGFAVVTPNHRSSSDAKFPAQINDIKAVVRFLRGNSSTYKLDTSFMGISGSSSGGHLSNLMGTSNGIKQYSVRTASADIEGSVGDFDTFSSDVDAVCDWFGPTDFLKMDSCGSQLNHDAANSPESSLIGGAIQNNKDKVALANPITYIDPTDPPFLVIHGDKDALVPYCQSVLLNRALQRNGVSSQYIQVPNGAHGGNITQSTGNINTMVQFFQNQLTRVVTSVDDVSLSKEQNKIYVYTKSNETVLSVADYKLALGFEILSLSGMIKVQREIIQQETVFLPISKGMYVLRIYYKDGQVLSQKVLIAD